MKWTLRIRPALLIVAILATAAVAGSCSDDDDDNPTGPVTGPVFDSGNIPNNGVYVRTFAAGETGGPWSYRCTIHAGMTGSVTVTAAGVDSPVVTMIGGNQFSPNSVDVKPGGYVKWVNNGGMTHTVTRP